MSFEPEPSVEDGAELQQQRAGAYVRRASVSTGGRVHEYQPLVEVAGTNEGGDPMPDTGRPGLLTSTNVEPGGRSASTRSATATFNLTSSPPPSRTSTPERRWKTSSPSLYDADATRAVKAPAWPTACAAVAAPAAVSSAPVRTEVRVQSQIRRSLGRAAAGRRSITRPRIETSQLSEPRRRPAPGRSATTGMRNVCGKAPS